MATSARLSLVKQKHRALVHLEGAPEGTLLAPFYSWARDWFGAAAEEVAQQSGGKCGVLQSAILASASSSLAWERFLLTKAAQEVDRGGIGLAKCALNFGDSARRSLAQLQQMQKGIPQGFVDPLADEDDAKVDEEREARAEKIHRKMRAALKKTDKKLQAEPVWMEQSAEVALELSELDERPLETIITRPAKVLGEEEPSEDLFE